MAKAASQETELQMAERHIASAEKHVVQQEELVSRLKLDGLPTDAAEELLSIFRSTLDCHRQHHNRIMTELGR